MTCFYLDSCRISAQGLTRRPSKQVVGAVTVKQGEFAHVSGSAGIAGRNLEGSIAFYSSLFGVEPAKRRPGYANFAVTEPPLKLVLLEGEPDRATVMDHLGVEVATTEEVTDATARLSELGLFTQVEDDTTCCYARQDKVWVHGPGAEPWEVYTVKEDSPTYGTDGVAGTMPDPDARTATGEPAAASAAPVACCTPATTP